MKVVEYETRKGKPYMKVYYRYKPDHRGCHTIEGFEPYFYVDAEQEPNQFTYEGIVRVEETDYTTLFGEPLKKIVVGMPGDVKKLRGMFKRTFEADIPFTDRYRIDERPYDEKPPRIFFFDIETTSLDTTAETPIISIACYDTLYKKYVLFIWHPDKKEGDGEDWYQSYNDFYLKTHDAENQTVHHFQNEVDMLEKFCEFFDFCDPDIVTGWNSNNFDLPYLVNRLNEVNVGAYRLSPLNKVNVRKNGVDIKGRICFDMLPAYKKIHENNLDTFKLGEVGQVELGYGKEEGVTGDKVIDTWVNNPDLLIKYNFKDVQLLVELDEKIGIIDFYRLFADKINMSLDMTLHNSKVVDMYLLNYCHERKIALPTNTNRARKKIKGAKVLEPKRGLLKDLAVFDLKSLYPSIMDTFNMSPETVNGFMDFKQEPRGLIPQVLEELMEERAKLKAAGENDKQRVVKELMNSFYGIMLFPNFRLMVPEIGESITHVGREAIMWTKGVVERAGYQVVAGDSVVGSTPIVVRKNGIVDIIPIEDLYNAPDDGRITINNIEVLSDKGFTPIKYIYRHRTNKKIFVVDAYGGRVDCTEDHSLIVNGKEVKPTETDIVELIEYSLPKENDMDLTEAWALGFFCAEGSIMWPIPKYRGTNRRCIINYNCNDLNLLKELQDALWKIGIKSSIYDTMKSSQCYKLNILDTKNNYNFFARCLTKNTDKKVPVDVLNATTEVKKAFYEGYHAGDGTDGRNNGYIKEFDSIDQSLVAGISQILRDMEQELTHYTRYAPNGDSIVTKSRHIKNPSNKQLEPRNKIRKLLEYRQKENFVYDLETGNHHFCGGVNNILLHNTDSVFVEGVKSDEEAIELQKIINKSYDEFIKQFNLEKHKFIIEYEARVDVALFTGKKKRYALKTGDDYKIRGFQYRRSNVSRLGRELQYDVLTSILEGEDQKEIIRMVEAAEKTIKQGEDLDNIGIPQTISMPLSLYKSIQPHVRAAMYTNDHLEPQKQIGALDKILMFYIKGCPSDKPKTDVIALDFGAQLPSGYILDDKMHIEKIHKLIEPIYEAVGWKMVSSAQQTLSTF